jgi:DNA-binding phage protein
MIAMSRTDSPIRPIVSSIRFDVARVLTRMANEQGLSRSTLYTRLRRPRQTVDNWLCARAVPRLEDFPDVDKALGFFRGKVLVETGFVDEEATAKNWLATTESIAPEFRPFILDAITAAQTRSRADSRPEQGRLVG